MQKKNEQIRLKDIALLSQVSIPTVSRYLNGQKIKSQYAEKIERALSYKGWSRYSTQRLGAWNSDLPKVVGIIVPEIEHNYYSTILAGALEEAEKHNILLLTASSQGSRIKEQQFLKQLSKNYLDALIYIPVASWIDSVPEEISYFKNIPIVVAARRSVLPGRPHIYTDNFSAGYMATRYMINLNRKHIGFMIGVWEYPFEFNDIIELVKDETKIGGFVSLDRFRGYLKALSEYNIPYDPQLITISHWSSEGGMTAAAELMSKSPHVDGIITTSDTMAFGVMDTFKSHGISVPNDVSILGWDNSELANFCEPKLTSVEQPSKRMGASAVTSIARLLNDETIEDIVYDVNIVPRASTLMKKE